MLNHLLIEPIDTVGVTMLELRPNTPTSVEDLISRIADLVLERQSLRTVVVDSAVLERNRVELVRAHQELSYALIDRYCPPRADAA